MWRKFHESLGYKEWNFRHFLKNWYNWTEIWGKTGKKIYSIFFFLSLLPVEPLKNVVPEGQYPIHFSFWGCLDHTQGLSTMRAPVWPSSHSLSDTSRPLHISCIYQTLTEPRAPQLPRNPLHPLPHLTYETNNPLSRVYIFPNNRFRRKPVRNVQGIKSYRGRDKCLRTT